MSRTKRYINPDKRRSYPQEGRDGKNYTYKFNSLHVDALSDVVKVDTYDDYKSKQGNRQAAARRKDKKVAQIQFEEWENNFLLS